LQAEIEELAKKGERPSEDLLRETVIPRADQPMYWPTNWLKVAVRLKNRDETLERIKRFDPITCETLAVMMFNMRIFSFSTA
jgi:hypothetical protein